MCGNRVCHGLSMEPGSACSNTPRVAPDGTQGFASRQLTSSTVIARTLTSLCREVAPRSSSRRLRPIPRVLASSFNTASLAAESTGGAVTRTHSREPSGIPISLREARGWTLIETSTPAGWD